MVTQRDAIPAHFIVAPCLPWVPVLSAPTMPHGVNIKIDYQDCLSRLTIEIFLGGGVMAQRARAEDLEAQNRLLRADVARQSTQVSLRIRIDYQD
eukprot:SAG25_NODE_161_length_13366_cov_13.111973_7_plen_95_part_00